MDIDENPGCGVKGSLNASSILVHDEISSPKWLPHSVPQFPTYLLSFIIELGPPVPRSNDTISWSSQLLSFEEPDNYLTGPLPWLLLPYTISPYWI